MRTLHVSVKFEKNQTEILDSGSVVTFKIKDTDVLPIEAIFQTKLENIKSIPFDFSIDFDDSVVQKKKKTIFALSVRVTRPDGQLVFENHPELDIRDIKGNIQKHVDIILERN